MPASIIGWPDQKEERNIAEIAIPKLGSLYLTHSWDGAVKGLKDFPADQRPPVAIVYFAFRIMVGIALSMVAMVVAGFVLMARRRLDETRWYLRALPVHHLPRLYRGDRRLDHDRSRPPAVDDLRPDAHGGIRSRRR